MPRLEGSNTPGINAPALTDFATQNYSNVMQKTMSNYELAMSNLSSSMQTDNNEWQRLSRENQQRVEEQLAIQRQQAEAGKQGGSDFVTVATELGKGISSVLLAQQALAQKQAEAQAKAEQQAFDNNIKVEELQLKKGEVHSKQAREQLDMMLESQLSEYDVQVNDVLASGTRQHGITYAKTLAKTMIDQAKEYGLSGSDLFYYASKVNGHLARRYGENVNEIIGEGNALKNTALDNATTLFTTTNAEILSRITAGQGNMTGEQVNEAVQTMMSSVQSMIESDTGLKTMLSDPKLKLQLYTNMMKPIGEALKAYYQSGADINQNVVNTIELIDSVSNLENMRESGGITEGEYQRAASIAASKLGFSTESVKNLPTTQTNLLRGQTERQNTIEQWSEIQDRQDNLNGVLNQSQEAPAYGRLVIGTAVWDTINNKYGKGIQETKAELEHLRKNYPELARKRKADTQLELLNSYEADRKQIIDLTSEAAKLERDALEYGWKVDPPKEREYMIPPGIGLGVNPDGTPAGLSSAPQFTIVPAPHRISQADPKGQATFEAQLKTIYAKRAELGHKWSAYGINIHNPSDTTYLKELETNTKAVKDMVQKTSSENGFTPDSTTVTAPQEDKSKKSMKNNLTYELKRVGLDFETIPPEVFKTIPGQEKDKVDILTKYKDDMNKVGKAVQDAQTLLINGTVNQGDTDISLHKSVIQSTIDTLSESITEEKEKAVVIPFLRGNLKALGEMEKLVPNKYRWFMQKEKAVTSVTPPPSNFSSGNSAPAQPKLPKNSAPVRPTMPLKGALASSKYGYVPFKGGTITFTSDYKGLTRFGSRARPKHHGIDIVSTDKRIAAMQGGTVKYVGDYDGYGKSVVVETPDGHLELYAHLDSQKVKQGQVIDPGTELGIMGNTGRSRGAHLHFEVWRGKWQAWGSGNFPPGSWKNQALVDPIAYLGKFTGTVELPRSTGAPIHNESPISQDQQRQHTGVFKLSDSLVYSGGYIFDRNTGQVRKATQAESKLQGAVPIGTIGGTPSSNQSQTTQPDGSTQVEEWEIPQQAKNEGTFLFVRPSTRKARNGNQVLVVEGYKQGKKMFAVEAVSGSTGVDGNRTVAGQNGMLPDGQWTVARSPRAGDGAGVGDKFLDLTPKFGGHNRTAIGIHWDADHDANTAGCLATFSKQDRDKIYQFVQSSPQMHLYVNTQKMVKVLGASMNNPTKTNLVPKTNQNLTSYGDLRNQKPSNYGYSYLKDKPDIQKAFAQAGNKLGIPAVWLADMVADESGFRADAHHNRTGATGMFQVIPETLRWLSPMVNNGKRMTQQEWAAKGGAWQINVGLVAYLEQMKKEAGRGYNKFGDVLVAVWRGSVGLKLNDQQRRRLSDGDIGWDARMNRIGKPAGRQYSPTSSLPKLVHDHPRDGCPICSKMLMTEQFSTHVT